MRFASTMLVLGITLLFPVIGQASKQEVSTTIDNFVSKLYPQGSHYFWVINDVASESSQEMVVDIHTTLRNPTNNADEESRFLLLIIHGKLFAAQKIPLNAKVDCGQEEEV